jgi:hypothetical protein
MMQFESWLPEPIALEAEDLLSELERGEDTESKALVTELTSDLRMRAVWEKLSRQARQPPGRRSLLSEVLGILFYWEDMHYRSLLLPPSERKKRVSEIIDAINNLETVLDKNHELLVNYSLEELNPINIELKKIKMNLNKYTLFYPNLPRKINSDTAKRTFFMKELKDFMLSCYGKPLYREVTVVTSIVFDDQELTEDHVKNA